MIVYIYIYFLQKITKKLHLSKSKLAIFNTSGQLAIFFLISVAWAFYTIVKEQFFPEVHLKQ